MKTSNKILLGGLAAIIILIVIGIFRLNHKLETFQETQKTESTSLEAFHTLEIEGNFRITYKQSRSPFIEINAEPAIMSQITTMPTYGTFKLKNTVAGNKRDKANITLSNNGLEKLTIKGNTVFKTSDNFKADNLFVRLMENAKVNIKGAVNYMEADIRNDSRLKSHKTNCKNAQITASNDAFGYVTASDTLWINASGNSRVNYASQPKSININTTGEGYVEKH